MAVGKPAGKTTSNNLKVSYEGRIKVRDNWLDPEYDEIKSARQTSKKGASLLPCKPRFSIHFNKKFADEIVLYGCDSG